VKVSQNADGRTVYTFRQSWVSTALMCLERGRREAFEGVRSSDTDATIIGTAGHVGVEHALTKLAERGQRVASHELVEYAVAAYLGLAADPTVRWVQGDKQDGVDFLRSMMAAWHREIYPQMSDQLLLEQHFVVPFYETPDYDVVLEGTIDCVDLAHQIIWDWKHVGSPYKQWEKQRWAVQPTAYAHAAAQVGILTYPITFKFTCALKRKTQEVIEVVEVQRTAHHALFLAAQLDDLIALHGAGLASWPRVDQHALCSERWCPSWSTCKGAHVPMNEFLWKP
jgi:hypothetical protein